MKTREDKRTTIFEKMNDIYENWPWSEKVDYFEATETFRKFAN